MTQNTDAAQPVAWQVTVTEDDGDCASEAASYEVADEAEANRLAEGLRAAYATAAAAKHDVSPSNCTVAVAPVRPAPAGRPVVKYTGYVHPASPSVSRYGDAWVLPGLSATVVVVPAGQDPAWLHGVQVIQHSSVAATHYTVVGADETAVRTEQARLWAQINPEAPALEV